LIKKYLYVYDLYKVLFVPLLLLSKPFGVLSQFTDRAGRATLADYAHAPGMHVAGRLDFDSEGLVLLTDHGPLQARITQPRSHLPKTYWAQVEGTPNDAALKSLRQGVMLSDGRTRPADALLMPAEPPLLWPRNPPIRRRMRIPTHWIELTITEGRNRQVRRMTAAVGLPTLRLIRWRIGPWTLEGLALGQSRLISNAEAWGALDQFGASGSAR
jgi:23S rRNA pseudouridine2457 synthase